MDRNNGFIDVGNAVIQRSDNTAELVRCGVADGIWNIDGGSTGIDGGFYHQAQVVYRRAASVFTGELNVFSLVTGAFD